MYKTQAALPLRHTVSASSHRVPLCLVPLKTSSLLSPQPLATTSLDFLTVLWVETKFFHGIARTDFQGPHTGDCGVANRFICVEGCPRLASVRPPSIPPRKRSDRVLSQQQGQSKGQCPEFLLHVKAEPCCSAHICGGGR